MTIQMNDDMAILNGEHAEYNDGSVAPRDGSQNSLTASGSQGALTASGSQFANGASRNRKSRSLVVVPSHSTEMSP